MARRRLLSSSGAGRMMGTGGSSGGGSGGDFRVPTPREIYKSLDEYVIGQDSVKRALAVAVHTHYLRLFSKEKARYEQVGLVRKQIDLCEDL